MNTGDVSKFAKGDKVRYKASYLESRPDLLKRFSGRIGTIDGYRLGALHPIVDWAQDGRRKPVRQFEVPSRHLEPVTGH